MTGRHFSHITGTCARRDLPIPYGLAAEANIVANMQTRARAPGSHNPTKFRDKKKHVREVRWIRKWYSNWKTKRKKVMILACGRLTVSIVVVDVAVVAISNMHKHELHLLLTNNCLATNENIAKWEREHGTPSEAHHNAIMHVLITFDCATTITNLSSAMTMTTIIPNATSDCRLSAFVYYVVCAHCTSLIAPRYFLKFQFILPSREKKTERVLRHAIFMSTIDFSWLWSISINICCAFSLDSYSSYALKRYRYQCLLSLHPFESLHPFDRTIVCKYSLIGIHGVGQLTHTNSHTHTQTRSSDFH